MENKSSLIENILVVILTIPNILLAFIIKTCSLLKGDKKMNYKESRQTIINNIAYNIYLQRIEDKEFGTAEEDWLEAEEEYRRLFE